jgi:hypothetical protein
MSTPIPFPLLNGVRHGFSSIELKIGDQIFIGFKSINFSITRSRSQVRGNHPDPLGWTRGENEYKADCELYLAELMLLLEQLGDGWQDLPIAVLVTYGENGFDTNTVELTGCHLDGLDFSASQGTDALAVKVDLNPLKILVNGRNNNTVPLVPPPGG